MTGYLNGLNNAKIVDRGKTYVDTDECSRTGADGLYVAGRLAEKPHQAIICAGHGAKVTVTLLDNDQPFYHDWMTPAGYFTGHGRDLPPGCEEIEDDERRQREQRVLKTMRDRFTEPHPAEQVTYPSLGEV